MDTERGGSRAAPAFARMGDGSGICSASRAPSRRAGAATADSSADIPGVPLCPGIVVGTLGGSIYDVVYRLDVAPGSVILASLTGSSGTDFDLYLFDGSATTVVTNQGVSRESTGPTSTESISYATSIGGRFYIDLNSATAAVGTYTLVVQVVRDRAPDAALVLGLGHTRTNSPAVPASLTASGSLSGPSRMAFSGDGVTWQAWQPYQAVTTWTFAEGDGTKTLWAKVENGAGVASAPVKASIMLDTERPSVIAIEPAVNVDLVGTTADDHGHVQRADRSGDVDAAGARGPDARRDICSRDVHMVAARTLGPTSRPWTWRAGAQYVLTVGRRT